MSAEIVQLHREPTISQLRRANAQCHEVLESTAERGGGRTLCQDLVHLLSQVRAAAFLVGAKDPKLTAGTVDTEADIAMRKLYTAAYALFSKAVDDYPVAQDFPKQRKRKINPLRQAVGVDGGRK